MIPSRKYFFDRKWLWGAVIVQKILTINRNFLQIALSTNFLPHIFHEMWLFDSNFHKNYHIKTSEVDASILLSFVLNSHTEIFCTIIMLDSPSGTHGIITSSRQNWPWTIFMSDLWVEFYCHIHVHTWEEDCFSF